MKKLLLISLFFAVPLVAEPMLNDKCGIAIKTPPRGDRHFIDKSCRTVYVAPPQIGRADVRALAPTSNLQFCSSIKRAENLATGHFKLMEEIQKRVEELIADYKPMLDRLIELRQKREVAIAASSKAKAAFVAAEAELASLKAESKKAHEDLEDCRTSHSSDPAACTDQKKNAEEKQKAHDAYKLGTYRPSQRAMENAVADADEATAAVIALSGRYDDAVKPLTDLALKAADLHSKTFELYKGYAGLDGATGQIVYASGWGDLVEEYRKLNEELGLAFTAIPVKSGQVWASVTLQGKETGPSIPAVNHSVIPGLQSPNAMPNGDKVESVPLTPTNVQETSSNVLTSLSGSVTLSLTGACPFFNGPNDPVKDVNFEQLSAYLTPNATYTYELGVLRGYTADYNLSQMMSRFEEFKKSGGFFSTSTVHTVIENNNSSEWFKMEPIGDSSEFKYSDAEWTELKRTVKEELADRALRQVATFNSGGAPALPSNNQQSGAMAISVSLRSCPLWYCQAGSLVFGVLDSIFGSSSAVSNFKRNNSAWQHEEVKGISFVERASTITFATEKKALPVNNHN